MDTHSDSRPLRSRLLFIVVTLLYWCSLYTYVPILAPYMDAVGFTFTASGIVLASYGLMQIIVRFPLGLLSDRMRKRKPYIVLGFAASAVGCFLFVLTDSFGGMFAGRAITGVAASSWVAFTVLYASYFRSEAATKAMGALSVATVVGQLAGMGVSGVAAEYWGWRSTFWIGGLVAAVGAALSLFIYERKEGVYRQPIRVADLAAVVKSRMLLKVSLLSILAHGVLFVTMFGFMPSYAVEIGASKTDLSWLTFAFMIPHAAAAWLGSGLLAPKIGIWPTIVAGFVLSGLCTAGVMFIDSLNWLYATQALNGFAQGLHMPLLLGLAIQTVAADKRATAMGFYQAAYGSGMFAGPFAAGWLNESYGLTGGFVLGGCLAACAAALAVYWGRAEGRRPL